MAIPKPETRVSGYPIRHQTFSDVGGQMPPLAIEAPITANDSVVISIEHD